MKSVLKLVMVVFALFALVSCAQRLKPYTGPAVTAIEVHKADRKMYLLHGAQVLEAYDIKLGGNPVGPKQFEGDGKTPEGKYFITHRNPRSAYHLSLGLSYPNVVERDYATTLGKLPGGDIFIHGENNAGPSRGDWTVGCIAVTDRQIEQIYMMVNPGTPISIYP